jgi:hypothetical protein
MNIASPRLVQLHAPLGWPPCHLGGMRMGWQQYGAHGAAHRSSNRCLASNWPSRQIGESVRGYPAGSSVRWSARRVQSSIIAQADTLYSYASPTALRTRASAAMTRQSCKLCWGRYGASMVCRMRLCASQRSAPQRAAAPAAAGPHGRMSGCDAGVRRAGAGRTGNRRGLVPRLAGGSADEQRRRRYHGSRAA